MGHKKGVAAVAAVWVNIDLLGLLVAVRVETGGLSELPISVLKRVSNSHLGANPDTACARTCL